MADKKEINATLIDGKIVIKCSINKKENYVLRIPKVGFYASTRTNTLEFSATGVTAQSVGNELDMDYELVCVKDKKVVASGFVNLEVIEVDTANKKVKAEEKVKVEVKEQSDGK